MTKEEFNKFILDSNNSYKFLAAEDGYWMGVDDNGEWQTYLIKDMSAKHRQNCKNYLQKQQYAIERGFFLQGTQFEKKIMRI